MSYENLRIGLALGGGGSKGAFTVGVLEALTEFFGIRNFPVISGTSTGALAGTMVALERMTELRHLYTSIDTRQIVNPNQPLFASLLGDLGGVAAAALFGNASVFDATALSNLIAAYVDFDDVKDRANVCRIIYCTAELQSGEMRTFDNVRHSAMTLRKALLASASEPVLMPPVTIKAGDPPEQLVDGGIREILPIGPIFEFADRLDGIIAISTSPLGAQPVAKSYDSLIDILGRTIEILLAEGESGDVRGAELVNALLRIRENAAAMQIDQDRLFDGISPDLVSWLEKREEIPVLHVGPPDHLPDSSLVFEPKRMKELLRLGQKIGKSSIRPFLDSLEEHGSIS